MRLQEIGQKLAREGCANSASALLLNDLRAAHQTLLAAMAVVENLTAQGQAERRSYTNARWRISQCSLARRTLWMQIFRHLLPRVNTKAASDLAMLQSADEELQRDSSSHVATWHLARIETDWESYCEASRAVRSRMSVCIEAEKRILYPILEHDAGFPIRPSCDSRRARNRVHPAGQSRCPLP